MDYDKRSKFEIPVVMIVYKRLALTQRSFEPIRKLQPQKLYIIADGPRTKEDEIKTKAVREYIDTHIDWECEVHRNYADKNYGLRYRMPSGMKWVFETEEQAIFLEDDIEATESFFYFCRDMLEHYKDEKDVLMISGCNIFPDHDSFKGQDICFSQFSSTWGWACWKRSFEMYDVNIRTWPVERKKRSIKNRLTKSAYDFFLYLFDDLQFHWYNEAWDYQWNYLMLTGKGLGIVPRYNLLNNIGMGDEEAGHKDDPQDKIEYISSVKKTEIALPIKYPEKIKRNEEYDVYYQSQYFPRRMPAWKRLKYSVRHIYYDKIYRIIKEMERNNDYINTCLDEKEKLTDEEKGYNKGDIYRLTSPKDMIKTAKNYKKYQRKNHC